MKSLDVISNIDDHARQVMETTNLLARMMRRELRRRRPEEISQPQFRALRIIKRHAGLSLSHLAMHLDLTLASASKMVDVLVKHDLLERRSSPDDRRKLELYLTPRGLDTFDQAELATQQILVEVLQTLPEERLAVVLEAMQVLNTALTEREGMNRPVC
ncbi:MAG: MarR family winged helix-turn-helix transcriptional regulator [Armatimonadota bacterium]